jgi:hypothetical protein
MAAKYAVIPESYLKRLQSKNTGLLTKPLEESLNGPVEFIEETNNNTNSMDLTQLIKVFPKPLVSKAKLFLHSLQGHITLDNLNRVLYGPDLTPGSSVLG